MPGAVSTVLHKTEGTIVVAEEVGGKQICIKRVTYCEKNAQRCKFLSAVRESWMLSTFRHPHIQKFVSCDAFQGESGHLTVRDSGAQAVLGDLGSAVEEGETVSKRFRLVTFSPGYVSPEVLAARGEKKTRASDIWSLGVVGLELLSGIYVIDLDAWEDQTRNFQVKEELKLLEVENRALLNLFLRMVSVNPEDRPSAEGVLRGLKEAGLEHCIPVVGPPPPLCACVSTRLRRALREIAVADFRQGASPRDIVCSLQSGDLRVSSSRQPEDSFPPPDTEWESIFDSWGTIENEESHQGLVLPACLQASTNPPVSPVSKDLSTPPVTPHPKPDPYESTGILSFPTESPNGGPQPSPPPSCSMLDWVGAVVLVIAQESWRGLWG
uniref:non-specific serine/threonine protein kinase n=1 Tax=Chromera velia CCMP2878 TaxID=1169474 RepID=A0A0G4FRT5_9ALVE|eukprot:Cvel_18448.t1-p1 / transcript=Cvel_18448.t1 / gene=Cvel_18448 / organism=Chromera_velia_CCMP2878 / gene_product=hypothetical protein / transcript_product=hypothetical protein / location=Cvel_scaffold1528:14941-18870(-) / protein_length=381 / sequence_SO=supercontig / SO=protein_coding / is_pseudo=false